MKQTIIQTLVFFFVALLATAVTASGKKDLAYFAEKEAIMNTVNDLFIGTDNRDWELVESVFADNVLFDMSSLTKDKPSRIPARAIVEAWDKGLRKLQAIHHQIGNVKITIDGNEADVFCYGIASHYLPNKSNRNTRVFVGSYDLHLIKSDNKWRIDGFKFNFKYMDGNPNLEAEL